MKLDQETLLKHRFWISSGVFALLWLIAFMMLVFSVSGNIHAGRKDVEAATKNLSSAPVPKGNSHFLNPLEKKQTELQNQKQVVWELAWRPQAELMVWPGDKPVWQDLSRNGYFGDPISEEDLIDFRTKTYKTQFTDEIAQLIAPAEFKDGWDKMIQRVIWENPTTVEEQVEEAWLAQEQWWIQKELLQVIRNVLDKVSKFENMAVLKPVELHGADLQLPKGILARQRFKNFNWELDLLLQQNDKQPLTVSGDSTIKNIGEDQKPQSLAGLHLRLSQRDAAGVVRAQANLDIVGGRLAADQSQAIGKAVPLPDFQLNMPIAVEVVDDEADPLPAGFLARQRFRTPNWQVELLFQRNNEKKMTISSQSSIKNINPGKRALSLHSLELNIQQVNRGAYPIRIPTEFLAWGKSSLFQEPTQVTTFDPAQPVEVTQILKWDMLPIKRLDVMEIETSAAQCNRTSKWSLIGSKVFKNTGGSKQNDAPPPGKGGQNSKPGGGPPARTGQRDGNRTANGLNRNRYLAISDQARNFPVSLVLMVDQSYLQDVLTAVANSRLRIQITQVQWEHVPGIKPSSGGKTNSSGSSQRNPRQPGRNNRQSAAGFGDEDDTNLVQLTVYGIASLYERYPPKQSQTQQQKR